MSERNGYEPGVPCWVAGVHPDPDAGGRASTRTLFGWKAEDTMPSGSPGRYFVCTLRGRPVAAIGSERGGGEPPLAAWGTHRLGRQRRHGRREGDRGGRQRRDRSPSTSSAAARVAVCADPAGAVFCLWEPAEHTGAQLVNEPGAWSMSTLNTSDPEGAKDVLRARSSAGRPTRLRSATSEITLWRLPGYVGGEPEQPVPRDVIAVMAPLAGDPVGRRGAAALERQLLGRGLPTPPPAKAAELGGTVLVAPVRDARSARPPSSPIRRARSSR